MPDNTDPQEEKIEEPTPKAEGGEDHEESKDRTSEQFEKLTTSNKELKKENEELQKRLEQYQQPTNQAPSAQNFSHLNQQQVNDVFQGMVDQDGYLDGQKLMSVLNNMNFKIQSAEEIIKKQNAQLVKDKETAAQKEVYKKYPGLNPKDKDNFDPKFHRHVYNSLAAKAQAGQMPTEEDYINAADEVYNDFYKDQDMKKADQEKLEQAEEQKAQSSAPRPRSSMDKNYYKDTEHEAIIQDVRAGKRGALAALLNKMGQ